MIFRRYSDNHLTKTHLKILGLHRVFKPWTEAVIRGGSVRHFLCPRIRNNEYDFMNANGENLEHWLRQHAKGSFILDAYPKAGQNLLAHQNCDIRVRFTDPDSALMFKLQMGGR